MKEVFNMEKLFSIFNYVFWFFILNIFFMILNFPLIFFILSVGIDNIHNYFPLFLLCLIPLLPSLTVLIYCMNKLIRNKDLNLIKDFVNGIRLNFCQSISIGCGELVLILILYSNIKFFSSFRVGIFLNLIFVTLLIGIILVTPYIYILISRFSMKSFDIIKASLILTFTKPMITLTNLSIIILPFILFQANPGVTILFISSIFTFLLSFSNKSLLDELESSINK